MRPSDAAVLEAVTAAARLVRGHRDDVPASLLSQRARKITAAAMREVFPKLAWSEIARMLGEDPDRQLNALVIVARQARWWNEIYVDEIVGVFLAPFAGEQSQ